jgi:HKD family nuclease
MKATFLGHGLNSAPQNNVGKQLAKSFDSKVFDSFMGFVAFAAVSGVSTLLDKIKKAKTDYKTIRFYVGVDNKGTSKEALELLVKEDIETYIYHREENYITYHPKLFIFEGHKFSRMIVGSSNLTNSGFKSNIEASIQLDFRTATDKQGIKLLTEIKEYYTDLINLTDKNLKRLDSDLIIQLENKNLLYSQLHIWDKKKELENQPTDGENNDEESSKTETVEFDINSGFEPIDNKSKQKNLRSFRKIQNIQESQ